MTPKKAESIILKYGWYLVEQNGSHRQYKHAGTDVKVTIPFHTKPRKDLAEGTLSSIAKQAGLDKQLFLHKS